MDELWKPVPSLDGVMASNMGRVLFPEREIVMPNGGTRKFTPKPTFGGKRRSSKTARHQYMGIWMRHFGNLKIHRLVCEAFHGPVPFKAAVVIHADENAMNNRSDNLRWGTQKENLNAPGFIAYCRERRGKSSPRTIWAERRKAAAINDLTTN